MCSPLNGTLRAVAPARRLPKTAPALAPDWGRCFWALRRHGLARRRGVALGHSRCEPATGRSSLTASASAPAAPARRSRVRPMTRRWRGQSSRARRRRLGTNGGYQKIGMEGRAPRPTSIPVEKPKSEPPRSKSCRSKSCGSKSCGFMACGRRSPGGLAGPACGNRLGAGRTPRNSARPAANNRVQRGGYRDGRPWRAAAARWPRPREQIREAR